MMQGNKAFYALNIFFTSLQRACIMHYTEFLLRSKNTMLNQIQPKSHRACALGFLEHLNVITLLVSDRYIINPFRIAFYKTGR